MDFDSYRVKRDYPRKVSYRPTLPRDFEGMSRDRRLEAYTFYENEMEAYEAAVERWKTEIEQYTQEQRRNEQRFREEVIDYVGLTGHPKANAAFDLAWQYGHANGYEEVYTYLLDFAELLK